MKEANDGYTLVELLVVILIFSIVMTLISVSFSRIVGSSSMLVKSAETDIGGLIGLELVRNDLELAGFGLPWSVKGATYSEADSAVLVKGCKDGCPDANAVLFNDHPALDAPMAYKVGDQVGYNGSDYLVLKGTAMGASAVSRSWCYLSYSSVARPSRLEPELKPEDRVIVLKTGITAAGTAIRELVTTSAGSFSLTFDKQFPASFSPKDRNDTYLVYGVAPADEGGLSLSFPFNRADYYISRTEDSISAYCNSSTGVLYKTTLNQNGSHTYYPILDCVADMQMVLFWDTDENGQIDYHSEVVDEVAGSSSDLRARLKEIRVYILAQQGRKDSSYLYPVADPDTAVVVGDSQLDQAAGKTLGRVWTASEMSATFGTQWRNYRWKLYSIVVQPRNL